MARFDFIATYIVTNKRNGTLYTGSTADLPKRVDQHKAGTGSHFTAKYGCSRLVWYEKFERMENAHQREKRIKSWPRKWKVDLIEKINPNWDDLQTW